MTFDEFRLLIQPDLQDPARWSVHVQKCPLNALTGPQGTVTSTVTTAQLERLRNTTAQADLTWLKTLGASVLDTIMPPQVKLGFKLCIDQAAAQQKGVRLVVSMLGDRTASGGIGTNELPVEAAFSQQLDFIATNTKTPVSRGIAAEADREPVKVSPPLRILVVASEPSDMPPVHADAEKQGILDALQPLINSRAVVLEFCEPPTLMQLNARLQEGFHVVHFIGHGDFEIAPGIDPNPQPHLYFEDGTPQRRRRAAHAEQLYTVLRNGNVPLAVLTACSSAAASPNDPTHYPGIAFESLARSLVERQSGPVAAIGMQFDLETQAARVFSEALYEKLLTKGWSLDEAVSHARNALLLDLGPGHRSWVNPTVYWRCKEGRVFEFLNVTGDLTPEQRQKLVPIDAKLDEYERLLDDLSHQPADIQVATAPLRSQWRTKIQELLTERGLVLGDTVRLRGGNAAEDGTLECALTLQLRLPETVGDVKVTVQHDPAEFDFVEKIEGRDVPAPAVFIQEDAGMPLGVLVQNASRGANWAAGEYELARLKFRLKDASAKPLFYIRLDDASVTVNGAAQPFRTLNAAVFAG